MVRHVQYVHYFTRLCDYFLVLLSLDVDILELIVCCWCCCEFVHFVPMFTVDRRQTMSPPTVNWALYRHLRSLPMVTVWLNWLSELWVLDWDFQVRTLTHTATDNYHLKGG
jgi:hypothetical protein